MASAEPGHAATPAMTHDRNAVSVLAFDTGQQLASSVEVGDRLCVVPFFALDGEVGPSRPPMKNERDDAGIPLRNKFVADINGKRVRFKPVMSIGDMLRDDNAWKRSIAPRFKDEAVHGAALDIEGDDFI